MTWGPQTECRVGNGKCGQWPMAKGQWQRAKGRAGAAWQDSACLLHVLELKDSGQMLAKGF